MSGDSADAWGSIGALKRQTITLSIALAIELCAMFSELRGVAKLASGQYRGEFTRAAYGCAEVDQGLLYGFER
jgi:hypothetical protein